MALANIRIFLGVSVGKKKKSSDSWVDSRISPRLSGISGVYPSFRHASIGFLPFFPQIFHGISLS